jgi:hypothetical protein
MNQIARRSGVVGADPGVDPKMELTIMTTSSPWRTVDVATLTPSQKTAYDKFQGANKTAAEARKAFETVFLAGIAIPVGKVIKLSYRYGLGVAILDSDGKTTGGKKATSLADFLKSQEV